MATRKRRRVKSLVVVDAETDPFLYGRVPKPFLWDVYDGQKHFTFEHTSDCIHYLMGLDAICYAHNGGKFDYLMPGFLKGLQPDTEINGSGVLGAKIMVIAGRLARFKMGKCEFRDSVNILPIKLADYQKEEIDYGKFERKVRHKHMKEITAYLHKDTEYLWKIVSDFRETYGDGITLAGSAMKFWQSLTKQKAPHSSGKFYAQIAPFYYGGRCECFHVGVLPHGQAHMVDINSAYPYAMLHEHPISLDPHVRSARINEKIVPQSMYHVRADSKGALPARMNDGSLRFPLAKGDYFCTGWELQAGLDTKTVKLEKIHTRIDFGQTINFKKYIDHFYELKQAAAKKTSAYIFAKLFMNSLYGKFGSNPNEYANYYVIDPDYRSASGLDESGMLGDLAVVAEDLQEHEKRFYNVATAASITGFVRAYLWRHLCAVRKAKGQTLYCDTDSIVYTGEAHPFKLSKKLGEWSVEDGSPFCSGGIAGKKLYAFKNASGYWKKSCKGVDLEPEQIIEICKGAAIEYQRQAPSLSYTRRITGDAKIDAKALFVSRLTQLTGTVER